MSIDPTLFIYTLVFLGALLAFEGLRQILFGRNDPAEAASRRMRLYRDGATSTEVLQQLRRAPNCNTYRSAYLRNLDTALGKAEFTIKPGRFLLLSIAGALLVAIIAATVVGPAMAAGIGLLAGIFIPKIIVDRIAADRGQKIVAQLPDALEKMARGLKVGHPLNITLLNVAREAPDPLGSELGIVVDQVAYGDDLVSAIRELADRVDLEDVHFFAVTVAIQHGTGGNLARILMTLSKVIRDRATMRRRIKAISSEGRMTMIFMSFLPPGLGLIMSLVQPTFFGDVMDDPLFLPVMGFVAVMTVLNFLFLRRLVNFRF